MWSPTDKQLQKMRFAKAVKSDISFVNIQNASEIIIFSLQKTAVQRGRNIVYNKYGFNIPNY